MFFSFFSLFLTLKSTFLYYSFIIALPIARFSFSTIRFSCFLPPTSPRFDATRLGPGSEGNAQSNPQIHNLPVAMRIIIEYQKLCYSLFHSARLLPTRPFREDVQYKFPGHYANLPNDTVPTSIVRRFGSPPTDDTCTNFRLESFRILATAAILIWAVSYQLLVRGITEKPRNAPQRNPLFAIIWALMIFF